MPGRAGAVLKPGGSELCSTAGFSVFVSGTASGRNATKLTCAESRVSFQNVHNRSSLTYTSLTTCSNSFCLGISLR